MPADALRPLVNYHSHTWRCQHAAGTEEDYVRAAVDAGYAVLGFADHTPWPYRSGFVSRMRMRLDQLDDYLGTVRALADKYRDRLFVPVGLECEAFPEYTEWLRDLKAEKLDYVLLGNHYDTNDETGGMYFGTCLCAAQVRAYGRLTVAGMQTGVYDYVAHPDLYCHAYPAFDADCAAVARDLCAAAEALDIPLEYNLLGLHLLDRFRAQGGVGYPARQFWEIASGYRIKAILGLDAHQTHQIARRGLYDQALSELAELGIEVLPFLPGLGGALEARRAPASISD